MTATGTGSTPPTLVMRGEIDMATSENVAREGLRLIAESEPGASLVVDLRAVTFLDSSGLSALVRMRSASLARGGTVVLRNVPERVERLLHLSGLAEHFPR